MAPVEPEAVQSNVKPLAVFGVHSSLVFILISTILHFLFKASDDLPPAYHTRRRSAKHKLNTRLFSALFAISLFVTVYHALAWRMASYRNWAQAHDVVAPGSLWQGWYANSQDRWQLARWIADVNLGLEADKAAVGSSKAFWWTYQQFIGLITWSIFVGIEARARNIPTFITICFVLLAELSGLSVGSTLFFVALAVTRVPLAPATASKSTRFLTPHPVIMLTPALLAYIWIYWLPAMLESSIWTSLSTLGYFIVPLLLSMLAQPNSLHRVDEHKTMRAARLSYASIFRILAWASFSIHALRTYAYATDNVSPKHEWHHHFVWTTHSAEEHTLFDQTIIALSKILGALHRNPVVSMTGWDVLLTEIGLCSWAVTRGLDVRVMLRSAGLLWSKETSDATSDKAHEAGNALSKRAKNASNVVLRKIPHLKGGADDEGDEEEAPKTLEDEFEDLIQQAEHATGKGHELRRSTRGRVSGSRKASAALSSMSPLPASGTTKGQRSTRSRKSLAATKKDAERENEDEEDAAEYTPTPATRSQVAEMAALPEEEDGALEETEAGALAWGLFVMGGLGVASAGVLGAEVGGWK